MAGISIGRSLHRPCPGDKRLRRCRKNEEADVILIDVDSENFDNVIIIDIPDSVPKKTKGSSMLKKDKSSFRNVINIDDDEIPESSHFVGVNNVRFSDGASSSRDHAQNFGDAFVEDCQFVPDKVTPVRLSKCKRTYSGKKSRRNRFGFDSDSEFDSSDSDYLDCEIVEDSSGKVQEEWEKAFSRRRKDIPNVHPGTRAHQNSKSKVEIGQHKKASCFTSEKSNNKNDASSPTSEKSSNKNDASSPIKSKVDSDFGCSRLSDDAINDQQHVKCGVRGCSSFRTNCPPSIHVEQAECLVSEPAPSCHVEERHKNPVTPKFASQKVSAKKFDHPIPTVEDNATSKVGPSPPIPDLFVNEDCCAGKPNPFQGEANTSTTQNLFECEINQGRSFPIDKQRNVQETAASIVGKRNLSLVPEIPLAGCDHVTRAKFQENKDGLVHSQNVDAQETSIITGREKYKETDEYKRAVEEEWASRQQAVLIQAEEARQQRQLLKRRRLESMRLLDMEKRQKERLEEIRNTQKKDEENMNLKETIRGEVRIELKKVEIQCKNMASLLHLLGIQVGGWPNPSPQEVQAAYKRALLTFHPDRAPQSDIRQQVEAEEKFKLINRLKEKFLPK